MLREMQDASSDGTGGGFYSAYDADSEGHEGKFYVWTRTEVRAALSPIEYSVFSRRFGLDEEPNFEGAWHTHVFVSIEQIGKELSLEPAEVEKYVDSARAKLLAIRAKRVWPGLDDAGPHQLERSGDPWPCHCRALLDRPEFAEAAERALDLRARICGASGRWTGRLLATAKDGVAHLNAYLDDYATSPTAARDARTPAGKTRTPPGFGRFSTPCSNISKTPGSAASSSRRTTTKR
jgi:uncharacterized protein YyaL (SSP411 family)